MLGRDLLPSLVFNNILRSNSSKRANNASALQNRVAARCLHRFANWRAARARSL